MLSLTKQQSQIFERIIRAKNGSYYKAKFLVARGEFDGKLIVSLISAEPIDSRLEEENLACLPCVEAKSPVSELEIAEFESAVSPYFNLNFLITSQPTRAPALSY